MSTTHRNWGDPKHFSMFSEKRISLSRELPNHPKLVDLLQKHPQDEFEILLAEIAAYCEVALDGDYLPEDLDNLCGILYQKLLYKRTGLILAHMPTTTKPS